MQGGVTAAYAATTVTIMRGFHGLLNSTSQTVTVVSVPKIGLLDCKPYMTPYSYPD